MRVIFDVEYEDGTKIIKYPDDKKFFTESSIVDGRIVATYTGSLELEEYLVEIKSEMLKEVRAKYQTISDDAMKDFNKLEISTFNTQKEDFRRWELDNTAATPTVDELANARGVDRVVLLQKIGVNVKAQTALIGTQQAMEDKIKACETQAELDAIII